MSVERRVKRAAAARNMTLSLAEELQAALTAESQHQQPARHHTERLRWTVGGLDDVMRCAGGGIAQFLVDVADLGSPDQVTVDEYLHSVTRKLSRC